MNIGKIIKLTENTVYIGYENGTLRKVAIESCDFEPTIGDYVEVYGDLVIKVDNKNNKVKKSVLKEISLVSKINIFLYIVLFVILCILFYSKGEILFVIAISLLAVSMIMSVLNLIFIIISSIKKKDINKSSVKCFFIALLTFILSICIYGFQESVSHKTTSQSTSSSSSATTTKSSSSSSTKSNSSSSTKSSSSASSSVSSKPKITVDKDKANYGEVDYNKWNHDEIVVGTKVRVYGKVLQAMEDGKAYTLRVAVNDDYDKIILVSIPSEYNDRVIAEDDHITLYGLAKGRQSYETVFKATKTLPFMVAYMYEN